MRRAMLYHPEPGAKPRHHGEAAEALLFDGVFRQEIFGSALAVSSQAKGGAGRHFAW